MDTIQTSVKNDNIQGTGDSMATAPVAPKTFMLGDSILSQMFNRAPNNQPIVAGEAIADRKPVKIIDMAQKIILKAEKPQPQPKIVVGPTPEPEPQYSVFVAGFKPDDSPEFIQGEYDKMLGEWQGGNQDTQLRVQLAEAAYRLNNYAMAVEIYEGLMPIIAESMQVFYRVGLCLFNVNQFEKAAEYFQRASQLNPDDDLLYHSEASCYMKLEQYEPAIALYQRAEQKNTNNPKTYLYWAHCLNNIGRHSEALEMVNKAIALNDKDADNFLELTLILRKLGQNDAALNAINKAIELEPDNATFWGHKGSLCGEIGDDEACLSAYRQSVVIEPHNVNIGFNTGMQLLAMGHWDEGFPLYSYRYERPDFQKMHARMFDGGYDCPHWHGEDINGKNIILHCEQGYGDSIMCIRFVKSLKQMGAKNIIVEAPELLHELFSSLPEIDLLITNENNELIKADYHCPLMELPRFLQLKPETIPFGAGYLSAPKDGRFQVRSKKEYVFALVWRGSKLHPRDKERSLPLMTFKPLIDAFDVQWLSLQRGEGADEIKETPLKHRLYNIGSNFRNFADSAALLSQCDCVIGVDTAPIHLAGSLGVRCYMLVDFWSDWRWLKNSDTSRWYDSLKMFRIPPRPSTPDKWDSAIDEMIISIKNEFHL